MSKSITQTTDDTKNLEDRLYVMSKVDEFFEKNVKEKELFRTKAIKWLKIDLMIFINKLKSVDEEGAKTIMDIVCNYIEKNIDKDSFKYLNEFEELKYEYLLAKNFDKLIQLLNYEFEDLKNEKIYEKDSHLLFNSNPDVFKGKTFSVDRYIREGKKIRYLTSVSLEKKHIAVSGFTVIPGIKDETFSDRKYSFYLINSTTHKTLPLKHKDVAVDDFSDFHIRFGESFSYKGAGYEVYIPYAEIRDNADFVGENRIIVRFEQDGIVKNFFAGVAKKDVRMVSEDKAIMRGDNYFCLKYDVNNELIIDISSVKHRYEELVPEENKVYIMSPEFYGNMVLHYDKDSINEEHEIPIEYDKEKGAYVIEIENLSSAVGQLRYEDGEPVVNKYKHFMCFHSKKGQCIMNALRDYHYDIKKMDNITEIVDIKEKGGKISIDAEFYATKFDKGSLKKAMLFLKDDVNQEVFPFATGEVKDNGDIVRFVLDLENSENTKNLYQGFHNLYAEYDFGEEQVTTELFFMKSYNYTYSEQLYDYRVYRSKQSTLRIQVKRKWAVSENNEQKRNKIANTKYKWFRHLPIKKKRIMFESMWGAKYSCNPRYLYEYIDEHHPEYECIWSLTDEHTPIKGKGIRVRRNSLKYFYYLATSKFFVNNVNFHNHYVKRKGQIEIQTMHGTPLKTLGLDVPGDFQTKKQEEDYIAKCERWNYLTVQSDFVAEISKSCFLYKKDILKSGYPRTDILYTKNNPKDIEALKKKMGLPLDKKVILYAPTWRIKNKFDLMLDLESFKKKLSKDYILILRLHHFSVAGWTQPDEDDFVYDLSKYDSAEELYLVSDVMITDYSSVMFDYSILNRPIILFTYDMDEYKEKLRGLYIDIEDDKPGPILYTSKEVEQAIVHLEKTEKDYYEYRQKFREKFVQYECGNSAEKIFNDVMKAN